MPASTKAVQQRPLLICCVISLFFSVASFICMPVVPRLALDLGIGPIGIGHINAAYFLTAGLFALTLGRLSTLAGKKQVALDGLLPLLCGGLVLAVNTTCLQ